MVPVRRNVFANSVLLRSVPILLSEEVFVSNMEQSKHPRLAAMKDAPTTLRKEEFA